MKNFVEYYSDYIDMIAEDYFNNQENGENNFSYMNELLSDWLDKNEKLNKKYLYIKAENVGWRNRSGHKVLEFDDIEDISYIYGGDDFNIQNVKFENDKAFMVFSSHDEPTGTSRECLALTSLELAKLLAKENNTDVEALKKAYIEYYDEYDYSDYTVEDLLDELDAEDIEEMTWCYKNSLKTA